MAVLDAVLGLDHDSAYRLDGVRCTAYRHKHFPPHDYKYFMIWMETGFCERDALRRGQRKMMDITSLRLVRILLFPQSQTKFCIVAAPGRHPHSPVGEL